MFGAGASAALLRQHCPAQCDELAVHEQSNSKPGDDLAGTYGRHVHGGYGPLSPEEEAAQHATTQELQAKAERGELPLITLAELQQRVAAGTLLVVYGGAVYDISGFAGEHPGGADALRGAAGQDLEALWKLYPVHFQKNALSTLEPYRVGNLSDADAEALREGAPAATAAFHAAMTRSSRCARRRVLALAAAGACAPLWWAARSMLRVVGLLVPWLGPRLVEILSRWLPCAVPGYGGAAPLPPVDPRTGKRTRVAVVGGGIAGVSCAYSLAESGYDVTVYESREVLGGNAQTGTFTGSKGESVTQDLSVLYWAPEFYRNYTALLSKLGVQPADVKIPYVIHTNVGGQQEFYTTPGAGAELETALQPSLRDRFAEDFKRYDRMVRLMACWDSFLCWGNSRPSFYKHNSFTFVSFLNPFNFISIRCCCRLFGMSEQFYPTVVQPFHGIQFTTVDFDSVPASGIPIVDGIVPLTSTRTYGSWGPGNSQAVFKRASKDCKVHLGRRVRQVRVDKNTYTQDIIDDTGAVATFDRTVLACPSHAAANLLRPAGWLERVLLQGVGYHDDLHKRDWKDWLESPVHQDSSCLPESHRDVLLRNAGFVVDVHSSGGRDGGQNIEYTHCLGSWSPSARAAGVDPTASPMLMTQSLHQHSTIDPDKTIRTFSAPRGHPDLSLRNGAITQLLHLIQGRHGVYFCSNWTGPGNGHDLSCMTGLVCAGAIGARYPFDDKEARIDYDDARWFMNL